MGRGEDHVHEAMDVGVGHRGDVARAYVDVHQGVGWVFGGWCWVLGHRGSALKRLRAPASLRDFLV